MVKALIKKQKQRLGLIAILDTSFLFTTSALMIWHGSETPRLPVYLYSLMPYDVEIEWGKYASILLQLFYIDLVVIARIQLDLVQYGFIQSIKIYIRIVEANIGNCKQVFDAKATERALIKYSKIFELVQQFNKIYRWPLLVIKGLDLLYISLCAIAGFRKPPELPDSFSPAFVAGTCFIVFHTALVLHSMAMAYSESQLFIQRLMENIALATIFHEDLWQKVNAVMAIEFQMGKLYVMRPITFLTYFSVIMSNLIVVLQIKQI